MVAVSLACVSVSAEAIAGGAGSTWHSSKWKKGTWALEEVTQVMEDILGRMPEAAKEIMAGGKWTGTSLVVLRSKSASDIKEDGGANT